MPSIEQRIAEEIVAKPAQVAAAVELLDGGATVPFIARYRKEATGGIDDTLRTARDYFFGARAWAVLNACCAWA